MGIIHIYNSYIAELFEKMVKMVKVSRKYLKRIYLQKRKWSRNGQEMVKQMVKIVLLYLE